MPLRPTDDLVHDAACVEEWLFTAWTQDGRIGLVSGHRLVGRVAWYWAAMVHEGFPMLHLAEWEVAVRSDPFVVKAPEMWAEHHCDEPMEQWSIGNEAYFVELDDPDEALGRGYGTPTPTAFDLEWYATEPADPLEPGEVHGYEQVGVVHGTVEVLGRAPLELSEIPAHRWHRWSDNPALSPVQIATVVAHTGQRAPFAFADGSVNDWVVTPGGWRSRTGRRSDRRLPR